MYKWFDTNSVIGFYSIDWENGGRDAAFRADSEFLIILERTRSG